MADIQFTPIPDHPLFIDQTGKRFSRLVVLGFRGKHPTKGHIWYCRCDCGTEKSISLSSLISKSAPAKSCGCLRRSVGATINKTHGMSRTTEYQSWNHAHSRCTNPKDRKYPDYGGRGIEFRFESFEQFYAELGDKPQGMSLDRINNDGHYEPGNVRWASAKTQANNRRKRKVKNKHTSINS